MKLETATGIVEGNAVFSETTEMDFDKSSKAFIMRSLTSLYSDPYTAIVREYASNAFDSHTLAGQTRPIEISTPSHLDSNLVVRDFGVGMSRVELREIYSKYGASTKRETNEQIGAFGLGAKSALSLAEQFTVVSIQDSKRNTVIISKNPEGIPELNFLDEQDTDEDNGVTITVPLPRSKANASYDEIFLGWPTGSIKLNGRLVENSIYNTALYTPVAKVGWTRNIRNENGRNYWHQNSLESAFFTVLIGPVSYKVKLTSLNEEVAQENFQGFGRVLSSLIINIPNGSVDMTPSREELIYSPRTQESLKVALETMLAAVTKQYEAELASATTRTDALVVVDGILERGFGAANLSWNGETVPLQVPFLKDGKKLNSYTATSFNSKSRPKHTFVPSTQYNEIGTFSNASVGRGRERGLGVEHYGVNHTYYIITGAPESITGKDRHPVTSDYSAYFKDTKGLLNATIYTLTETIDELDPWFVASVTKVIPAEEIREQVLKLRREQAAIRRLEGPKEVAVKDSISISVATVALGTNYTNYPKRYIPTYKNSVVKNTDFAEDTKFVLVNDVEVDNDSSNEDYIAYSIFSTLRGENKSSFKSRTLSQEASFAVINLFENQGYKIVSVGKGRNFSKIQETLNAEEFSTAFAKIMQDASTSLTELDHEWLTLFADRKDEVWTLAFDADKYIDEVKDEVTREFVKIGAGSRRVYLNSLVSLAGGSISAFYRNVDESATERRKKTLQGTFGASIADFLISVVDKKIDEKNVHSYPLLNNVYSTNITDVIEYINLKDSARQA